MASTIENMMTGAGREKCVTSSMPRAAAIVCGLGAPASPTATMPLTSAAVRPASRIACVDASSARASDERSFERENPVLPTPTIAIWSLIGLRAMSAVGRLERGERHAVAVDPGELHRHTDGDVGGIEVHDGARDAQRGLLLELDH